MPDIINSVKEEFINEYIRKIDTAIETYNATIGSNDEIFDLVIEISNVFENDIPNLQTSVLIRTGNIEVSWDSFRFLPCCCNRYVCKHEV